MSNTTNFSNLQFDKKITELKNICRAIEQKSDLFSMRKAHKYRFTSLFFLLQDLLAEMQKTMIMNKKTPCTISSSLQIQFLIFFSIYFMRIVHENFHSENRDTALSSIIPIFFLLRTMFFSEYIHGCLLGSQNMKK